MKIKVSSRAINKAALRKTYHIEKKHFIRLLVSFIITCVIISCSLVAVAFANSSEVVSSQNENAEIAPTDTSALYDLIGVDASQPLEIILLITVLSVAPSILIMMTSFTRIIIVFSFLRNAMQTNATPPNMVLTGLALFLTIFIMWPVFTEINEVAYTPYANGEIDTWQAVERAGGPLKTFMLKQTTGSNMKFFLDLADKTIYAEDDSATPETPVDGEAAAETAPVLTDEAVDIEKAVLTDYSSQLGFEVVIPAFMVSELMRAFQMGFMLFIPFLVIDIVVSSTLMSMGMMMLPPAMISLPFKIMLFVLVDGWQMLVGTLVNSFNL